MVNEIQGFLQVALSAIVFCIIGWFYISFKASQKELEALKEREAEKALADEKAKIHAKYDSEDLNDLLDSSDKLYSKLRPPKNN